MKKVITFIILCLSFVGSTQSYITFITADSSDVWKDKAICNYGGGPTCLDVITTVYDFSGDTTINNLNYAKLFRKKQITYMSTGGSMGNCPLPNLSPRGYLGAMREAGKQVFFKLGQDAEYVIYDFNLTIGDTVPDPANDVSYSIISAIDSIDIQGIYRKRFTVESTNIPDFYIIEGIGSERGLLFSYLLSLDCAYSLECYKEENSVVYAFGNCDFNLGTEQITETATIKIYPNPIQVNQNLRIASSSNEGVYVKIWDPIGRLIYQSISTEKIIETNSITSKGIYLIQLDESSIQELVVY